MGNITFTMIKPEAVAANNIGGILNMIEEGGFRIVAMKKVQLSAERAGEFYAVHNERPFYGELVDYMSGGPIIAAILEKDNAVADFRTLLVLLILLKLLKEQLGKSTQLLLLRMLCMVLILTKMLILKLIFISLLRKDSKL